MDRGSGILLGISSLPGPYGIGTMGQGARDFVDRLAESGQTYWQILPISPTGFGDSPYQSFSAFAGNPYFIDFMDLFEDSLLPAEGLDLCDALFDARGSAVDYRAQMDGKHKVLQLAYRSCGVRVEDEVWAFANRHAGWIMDYALFMALKNAYDLKPFWEWPEALANRDRDALNVATLRLKEQIGYHIFVQYLFFKQWEALREYARGRGIRIIGDMPIYIASDSADAWTGREMLDRQRCMAGCPPDYFSPTGQLWGNPVYDWDVLKKTGYAWWVRRVAHQISLFDYLRVDHFRGFESYYEIPEGSETAQTGQWVRGPGIDFFRHLERELGPLPLIAEDLGFLTPEVFRLLKETGYPGLKVLQFAFEPGGQSVYLPHRYDRSCVVYTGTHDNDTTQGWYAALGEAEKAFLDEYLDGVQPTRVHWQLIRLAMGSVADVCIIPMQDVLGLPAEARMNTPQTSQGNWRWRLEDGRFDDRTVRSLARVTALFGRSRGAAGH
jgi:4-alpha-glucanotransferase